MATAAITGTATPSIREADIVAGGKTIIITLTGDTWVASGATFDAQRQNIINGLDSAQAEAAGWDAQVKANLAVTTVVRTSNTVVTVTLSAQAAYNITARETVTCTIPATALTGAAQIVATPTINCVQGPATFYVATDGSDTAAGDTWATRRLTIQSAVTSANTAGDTVYVAPGTYRETVTFGSSGTAGNVISLIGDYTGANTSGAKGIVRITGSNDDLSATRANCISLSTKDYITIRGFVFDTTTAVAVTQPQANNGVNTGNTIDKCVSYHNTGLYGNSGTGTFRVDSLAITNCAMIGSKGAGINIAGGGDLGNSNTITSCILIGCYYGIALNDTLNVTITNCTLVGGDHGLLVQNITTAGGVIVYNSIFTDFGTRAMQGGAAGVVTENYNTFYNNTTNRTNVTAGANSVTRPPLFDARWFFEAVNGGRLITPFDLASYSTLVEYNSGTGAPSTDMRGVSQVGSYREWGAIEYNTYTAVPGGAGTPMVIGG